MQAVLNMAEAKPTLQKVRIVKPEAPAPAHAPRLGVLFNSLLALSYLFSIGALLLMF